MIEEHPIHQAAKKGFELGANAYERGRPGYPEEAVKRLGSELGLGAGAIAVDLGAGTGKFTRLLAASTHAKVLAIEPVSGMREKFSQVNPGIQILEGSAENIPLRESSVDAVIAAQAFHWFDGEKALQEIYRVLNADGGIGMIWNARDESIDWVGRLTQIIDPYEKGAPRYKTGNWKSAFQHTKLFTRLESAEYRHIHSGTVQTVVDRVASISFISALNEAEKAGVLQQVRELLTNHPQTQGKTQIDFPYRTDVFWCRKKFL